MHREQFYRLRKASPVKLYASSRAFLLFFALIFASAQKFFSPFFSFLCNLSFSLFASISFQINDIHRSDLASIICDEWRNFSPTEVICWLPRKTKDFNEISTVSSAKTRAKQRNVVVKLNVSEFLNDNRRATKKTAKAFGCSQRGWRNGRRNYRTATSSAMRSSRYL